jgi:signal peptidase I
MTWLERFRRLTQTRRTAVGEWAVTFSHLGGNRDKSNDSFFGFVPRESVFGKPWVIHLSYESTMENLPGSPLNPDHLQDLALNDFWTTRWRRNFQFVRGYPLE